MKMHARLQRGPEVLENDLELLDGPVGPGSARPDAERRSAPQPGIRRFRLGDKIIKAHCAEITPGVYSLLIDGRSYEAYVSQRPGDAPGPAGPYVVVVGLRRYMVELRDPRQWRRTGSSLEKDGPQEVVAPMPGRIVKMLVAEGQEVTRNQGLLIIEAMKMQNELRAPRPGRVERIYMPEGQGVETGTRLLRLA